MLSLTVLVHLTTRASLSQGRACKVVAVCKNSTTSLTVATACQGTNNAYKRGATHLTHVSGYMMAM